MYAGESGMAQERSEHQTVRGVALKSLKNELGLAVRLLRQLKEARETLELESVVIDSAREAYRHATDALNRMPQLALRICSRCSD